jgi:predicted nucleotidyltransferase/DNA-binding XRE family transcriptional regulator
MSASPALAGSLLRAARVRAGLTQVMLARRAGVAQSVISAYESGRRQPALPTLVALVEAAGYELAIDVRRSRRRFTPLSGPVGRRLRRHRARLLRAAAAHRVSNVRVFGSVARGEDRPDSDVDLLVDLPAGMGLLGLFRLQRDLEEILHARVDVVPADGLKPEVRSNIESELVML